MFHVQLTESPLIALDPLHGPVSEMPIPTLRPERDVTPEPAVGVTIPTGGLAFNLKLIMLVVAVVLPFLICILFVHAYGVNVPYLDDWDFVVQVFVNGAAGKLTLWNFFQVQQVEHKLFVPYVLMLASAKLTSFNLIADMYLNLAFLAMTIALLMLLAWPCVRTSRHAVLALIPVSWIMCNLLQWQNLLFAIQLCIYTVCFFSVLTVFLLERAKKIDKFFWLASVSAVLAAYSNANGFLIWPLGILQLFLRSRADGQGYRKLKSACILWSCLTLLFVAFYVANIRWHHTHFLDYPGNFKFAYLKQDPFGCVKYFLILLSNPFVVDPASGPAVGVVFLLLSAVAFYPLIRQRLVADRPLVPMYILVLIGLGFYALVFWGRVGLAVDKSLGATYGGALGMQTAMASRYCTVGDIAVVGLFILFLASRDIGPQAKGVRLGSLLTLVGIMTILSLSAGPPTGEYWYNSRRAEAEILRTYGLQSPQAVKRFHPYYEQYFASSSSYLEQNRLSVFGESRLDASKLEKGPDSLNCSIQAINDKWPLPRDVNLSEPDLSIRGWAFDPHTRKPYKSVTVLVDGVFPMPTACGLYRIDIDKLFAKLNDGKTGFEARSRTNLFSQGTHTISLRAFWNDGQHYSDSGPLATIEIH